MSRPPATAARPTRRRPVARATPSATGAPSYSETLPRVSESAVVARRLVGHALDVWHLSVFAEKAGLVVTELVANAAQHARGDHIRVTITRREDGGVHVGVVDKSRVLPEPRVAHVDETGGRGLALVDHMARTWGTDKLPWGKRVWAVVGG